MVPILNFIKQPLRICFCTNDSLFERQYFPQKVIFTFTAVIGCDRDASGANRYDIRGLLPVMRAGQRAGTF
jgi:hypothetical protein